MSLQVGHSAIGAVSTIQECLGIVSKKLCYASVCRAVTRPWSRAATEGTSFSVPAWNAGQNPAIVFRLKAIQCRVPVYPKQKGRKPKPLVSLPYFGSLIRCEQMPDIPILCRLGFPSSRCRWRATTSPAMKAWRSGKATRAQQRDGGMGS